MKPIYKHLIAIVTFLAGLAILLLVASHVLYPKSTDTDTGASDVLTRGISYVPENTLDAVFIGDSEAYSSFVPLQLFKNYGIPTYTSGAPRQPLYSVVDVLNEVVEKQKPKVVIIETNTVFTDLSLMNLITNKVTDVFSVIQYHNRWKPNTKKPIDYALMTKSRGYIYNTFINPADSTDYMFPTEEYEKIDLINKYYLKTIRQICEDNGIKLVFVSSPSIKNWTMKKHNSMEAIAQKMGVDFIDLNLKTDELGIDWSKDTYDKGDHINFYGATKVTAYIGEYLKNTGLFTDKRSDPAYANWNETIATVDYMNGR